MAEDRTSCVYYRHFLSPAMPGKGSRYCSEFRGRIEGYGRKSHVELGNDMDTNRGKRCRSIKMGVVGAMAIMHYRGHPALIREPASKSYVTRQSARYGLRLKSLKLRHTHTVLTSAETMMIRNGFPLFF